MADFYNHTLHKEYEEQINTKINIKDTIFEALEKHLKLSGDTANYPDDQDTLYQQSFPDTQNRTVPELTMSDYIMCLNNYRTCGNLFTMRYLHPIDLFCEVMFLDPNNNGKIYLFVLSSNSIVEKVITYSNIDLTNDNVEGIYY